jgi:hypothetical protein
MASTLITPLDIDTLTYDAAKLRRTALMGVMAAGGTLTGRSGVRPGDGGLTVSLAGSTINVSSGVCTIYQSARGVYRAGLASSSNTTPSTLTAAHATLPRLDLVYLRVYDDAVDSSGLFGGDLIYLAGTPSASPVAPTPAGTQIYMPLATITVPQVGGGSASVSTAVRPVTVAPGGILPAVLAPASPYVGQAWHDGTDLKLWSGSTWDVYQKVKTTAWTNLTPGSGFTTPQGTLQVAQARLLNVEGTSRVELRGSFDATAGLVAQTDVCAMPVGMRPTVLRSIPATRGFNGTTSGMTRCEISATAGVLSVFAAASPAQTDWLCLDGQHYDL